MSSMGLQPGRARAKKADRTAGVRTGDSPGSHAERIESGAGLSSQLDAAEAELMAGGGALYEVKGASLRPVRRARRSEP
jgi:hypothetical protein